jgi:CheY-like chemotaxis protein
MPDRESRAIERLTQLGGEDLVANLVGLYLDQVRERLVAARVAVRAGDVSRLAELAHALRSSSAQLGADDVVGACDEVADASDRGDAAGAFASFAALEARLEAFRGRLLARTTPSPPSAVGRPVAGADERPADVGRAEDDVRQRIAVIEDNADNRLLVDAILGDRYTLDEYETGADALSGMAFHRPDLILLDVSLPGMDGLDVLARLRQHPSLRDVPVVAVTAHAMAGDRERYLAAGFDGYVPKPIVDDVVLIDAVETLLAARSSD